LVPLPRRGRRSKNSRGLNVTRRQVEKNVSAGASGLAMRRPLPGGARDARPPDGARAGVDEVGFTSRWRAFASLRARILRKGAKTKRDRGAREQR